MTLGYDCWMPHGWILKGGSGGGGGGEEILKPKKSNYEYNYEFF